MKKLRAMTFDDIKQVYAVELAAHIAPWTEKILHDCVDVAYDCWVVEKDNNIVAFTIFDVAIDGCHIFNICVSPEHQRQGYGRQLLEHTIKRARDEKVEAVLLEVRASNKAAIGLYQQYGFSQTGVRKGYYPGDDGREDAIMLRLDL